MRRWPVNAAETFARRAAANDACSRACGSVSSRSAQPLPMKFLKPSEPGVVERFASRTVSSLAVMAGAAVSVVEVSLVLAMRPFSHRHGDNLQGSHAGNATRFACSRDQEFGRMRGAKRSARDEGG